MIHLAMKTPAYVSVDGLAKETLRQFDLSAATILQATSEVHVTLGKHRCRRRLPTPTSEIEEAFTSRQSPLFTNQ